MFPKIPLRTNVIRNLAVSALLLFTLTFQLLAADLTGKWKGNFAEGGDITFDLKSNGSALTGTMTGADGKTYPLSKGEIKEDSVAFTVETQYQGEPITVTLKGKVTAADKINVTMQTADGSWSTDTVITKI